MARTRESTAGVSHGPGYMCIIDGCPPGLPLSEEDLLPDLRRRRPGQSKLVTQRKEEDLPEIWSGVFEGKTDGTSIGILFRNTNQRSGDYGDIKDKYRPDPAPARRCAASQREPLPRSYFFSTASAYWAM